MAAYLTMKKLEKVKMRRKVVKDKARQRLSCLFLNLDTYSYRLVAK